MDKIKQRVLETVTKNASSAFSDVLLWRIGEKKYAFFPNESVLLWTGENKVKRLWLLYFENALRQSGAKPIIRQ